jgi:carbamate kinase
VTTVVALGGNALTRPGERGTAAEQLANLRETVAALAPLLEAEARVVVTHGNGPQAGNALLRHERAAGEAPPHPLWLVVAETQAEIGALIAATLPRAACLLTRVVVDPDDPAFEKPTKPIGPFYSREEADALRRERGWTLVEDAGRGFRRAVASPRPVDVVELDGIAALLDAGAVPVCCGGGGVPVDSRLRGVDAVIDKDRTSALLAERLGAERLLVLTDVPALQRGFGTADAGDVPRLTVEEAEALLPELPAGSMRPKVEACAGFVRRTGGEALITSAEALADALAGRAGTRLAP